MTSTSEERVVDARGRPCPIPVIELAKAVDEIEVGQAVRLHSDDPASKVDVPVWCRMRRQRFLGQQDDPERGWIFLVEKLR